ncbi:MAG: hypothetical protein CVU51_14545 [Deltaproteobacteria bacterium HGW-Deltaproteobacteria-1]|nr:MAG: hypothetical protein CVU51_14545 [Deltaproteobacteria bacterium HGW-Deltaproteobacteria-1]
MKKLFYTAFLAIAIVGFSTQISMAVPLKVEVIDSYYHVWGYAEGVNWDWDDIQSDYIISVDKDAYDVSASAPINGEASRTGNYGFSEAVSNTSLFGISINHSGLDAGSGAFATAEWTFRPVNAVNQLVIDFDKYIWESGSAYLKDLTSGTVLLDFSVAPLQFWSDNLIIDNNFMTDHTYRLAFSANDESYSDGGLARIQVLDMTAVPEPSSILLLGFGLIGLAGIRRKFKS